MQTGYEAPVLGLRTSPTPSYRRFILIWRLFVLFFAVAALVLEGFVLHDVYDKRFPAYKRYMSALPTVAVSPALN